MNVEHVTNDHTAVKKSGCWTRADRIELSGRRGATVLDLRHLPATSGGRLRLNLDLERSSVKLLIPRDAVIDDATLHQSGRGGVKDHSDGQATGGRIEITGQIRSSVIHIYRTGTREADFHVVDRFLTTLADRLHTHA